MLEWRRAWLQLTTGVSARVSFVCLYNHQNIYSRPHMVYYICQNKVTRMRLWNFEDVCGMWMPPNTSISKQDTSTHLHNQHQTWCQTQMYPCVPTCTYKHIHVHIYIHAYMYVRINIRTYMYVHVSMYDVIMQYSEIETQTKIKEKQKKLLGWNPVI